MNQPIPSDTDLIKGLTSCDGVIISRIYDMFLQHVRKLVIANRGNTDDALDLFQETLCVVYQKVRQHDFKLTCSLKTYILSIARHIWFSHLRDRKKDIAFLQSPDNSILEDDFYDIYEFNERMFLYRKHFEKLSESCRRILSLFLEGRTVREITEIMGFRSEQHTKNRRYRCKNSLIASIRDTFIYKELGK